MTQETELLVRLADCVRIAIEDGAIKAKSYVGTAWRDYAERYRFHSVTDEAQAAFSAIGEPLTPKVAMHRVEAAQPAAPAVEPLPDPLYDEAVKADNGFIDAEPCDQMGTRNVKEPRP